LKGAKGVAMPTKVLDFLRRTEIGAKKAKIAPISVLRKKSRTFLHE